MFFIEAGEDGEQPLLVHVACVVDSHVELLWVFALGNIFLDRLEEKGFRWWEQTRRIPDKLFRWHPELAQEDCNEVLGVSARFRIVLRH